MRPTVANGGVDDTSMNDGGFRWEIKDSIGVSEGLTAVYRFERELNTTITNQAGGRLVCVELSGEFGMLTTGQILSVS